MKSAFACVSSAVVLVDHSYGGTLITAAGTDPRVAALVAQESNYLAQI